MSISIEDILRSHGIGGGGGGGVKVITSTTQPIAGLTDGVVWYEPTLRKTKMYLGGEFQEVGGGGIVLTTLHARFKTTGVTNEVAIPVMNASVPSLNYNPSTDILIVSQNGTNITETIEYTLDKAAKKIVKTSGTWDDKTTFDFTAIVPTSTTQTDGVETVQIEDHVSVASGVTKVSFNITGFNTDVDLLEVHQRNMKIFKTRDWVLDPSGTFITLTEATTEPEEFHFTVTKKIRTVTSGKLIAGSDIVDNTISEDKLSFEIVTQTEFDNHKNDNNKHVTTNERDGWNSKAPGTHTHTMSEVTGLSQALDGKMSTSSKNAPNGFAGLDVNGNIIHKITASNFPFTELMVSAKIGASALGGTIPYAAINQWTDDILAFRLNVVGTVRVQFREHYGYNSTWAGGSQALKNGVVFHEVRRVAGNPNLSPLYVIDVPVSPGDIISFRLITDTLTAVGQIQELTFGGNVVSIERTV